MRAKLSMCLIGGLLGFIWLAADVARADVTVLSLPVPETVVIVDQSGSMAGGFEWLSDLLSETDNRLAARFRQGDAFNRYGLVGFVSNPRVITLQGAKLGPIRRLDQALRGLRIGGNGREDGYRAISEAMKRYGAAPDRQLAILLVTDEDRDVVNHELNTDLLANELAVTGTVLDVLVNVRFRCRADVPAVGINALGRGLVIRDGELAQCRDVRLDPNPNIHGVSQSNTSIRDYVDLALGSGGTAWSIEWARGDDRRRSEFTRAYSQARIEGQSARLQALPLLAHAQAKPARVRVHEVVTMDGSGSRSWAPATAVDTWSWDFNGDGRFDAAGAVVATIFDTPGEKVVTLRVGDRTAGLAVETRISIQIHAE